MGLLKKEKYLKYRPKKFLGQNFLVDDNIAKKIIRQLGITGDDIVIEIGPGHGALTKHLVNMTNNYFAVEIDKEKCDELYEKFSGIKKIFNKDFLKFDFENDLKLKPSKKIKIIGNIPYNLTTEILFKIFENHKIFETAILTIQKEVAERITAKPKSKEYGILSVQSCIYSVPKMLFTIPATAFFPKPKVNSAVLKLELKEKPEIKNTEIFKLIVRESFGQRRKMMRNSLEKCFESYNLSFTDFDFDFTRRAETVSPEEYIVLSNRVYNLIQK